MQLLIFNGHQREIKKVVPCRKKLHAYIFNQNSKLPKAKYYWMLLVLLSFYHRGAISNIFALTYNFQVVFESLAYIFFSNRFFVNFDLESKHSSTIWVCITGNFLVKWLAMYFTIFLGSFSNILLKSKCVRYTVLSHPVFYIMRITIVCDNACLITLMLMTERKE